MNFPAHPLLTALAFCLVLPGLPIQSQVPTPSIAQQASVPLTVEQRHRYQEATQYFTAQNYASALESARALLAELRPGTVESDSIARFASDAAINAGNYDFALATLKPLEAANPGDWKAAGMLARIYAETGKRELRDREIARILSLHHHADTPELANQQQFYLERIAVPGGTVRLSLFMEPYGRFNTELYAWVCDEAGQQLLRIALENSDVDQKFFAKEHPEAAKQGVRRYSLDGYEEIRQADGTLLNNHTTYNFYDGKPSYDLLRARMIEIGTSKLNAMKTAETK